ncbi:unnamed protein product, partial [Protopolystoma xenopodis]
MPLGTCEIRSAISVNQDENFDIVPTSPEEEHLIKPSVYITTLSGSRPGSSLPAYVSPIKSGGYRVTYRSPEACRLSVKVCLNGYPLGGPFEVVATSEPHFTSTPSSHDNLPPLLPESDAETVNLLISPQAKLITSTPVSGISKVNLKLHPVNCNYPLAETSTTSIPYHSLPSGQGFNTSQHLGNSSSSLQASQSSKGLTQIPVGQVRGSPPLAVNGTNIAPVGISPREASKRPNNDPGTVLNRLTGTGFFGHPGLKAMRRGSQTPLASSTESLSQSCIQLVPQSGSQMSVCPVVPA